MARNLPSMSSKYTSHLWSLITLEGFMVATPTSLAPMILIVEDHATLRRSLAMIMQANGYRVLTAATAEEATSVVWHHGLETFSLIISDIYLSGQGAPPEGYGLYEQWSAQCSTLSYLLISGSENAKALPAVRTGAVPLLMKPFGMEALLTQIEALLTREKAY